MGFVVLWLRKLLLTKPKRFWQKYQVLIYVIYQNDTATMNVGVLVFLLTLNNSHLEHTRGLTHLKIILITNELISN